MQKKMLKGQKFVDFDEEILIGFYRTKLFHKYIIPHLVHGEHAFE